ncbi:undecaprenyl diphosphate synthase family protein, partial [Bacillus cereus]|nr:undecaprenyl diphosphate synthase family protein [Bacillus cereus]
SNFLFWNFAYSEFWFREVYCADFKEEHLLISINEFQHRGRRFGGV